MALLRELLSDARSLLRGIAAILCGTLPRRRWSAFPSLPIERLAFVSGLVPLAIGFAYGVYHGLAFMQSASDALADAALKLKTDTIAVDPIRFASGLSPLVFLIATPQGWLSEYLVFSGFARALGAWFGDPLGDPILTGLDRLQGWARGTTRNAHLRHSREREEGAEVPDQLFTGEWADLPEVTFVVVASRRKPDWTKGTFVITDDKWYTLGEPFDVRLPQGLRTAYPLTEQKAFEVLRRGVRYELPPLRRAKRRH
jgi:hypothetical protein